MKTRLAVKEAIGTRLPRENYHLKIVQDSPAFSKTKIYDLSNLSELTTDSVLLAELGIKHFIWDIRIDSHQANYTIAFQSLFGEPGKICPFTWWLRRVHPDDRELLHQKFRHIMANKIERWEEIYRFRTAAGVYTYIQNKGYASYIAGKPVRVILFFQDISKIADLEDKLHTEKLDRHRKISEAVIRVIEKERSRLGKELHDNINQLLSCANLYIDHSAEGSALPPAIANAKKLIALAIDDIRSLSRSLVLPKIHGSNLTDHIETLIDQVRSVSGINIEFDYTLRDRRISAGKCIALYRILQEQLKNILTHSQARSVAITLSADSSQINFSIADNGIGHNNKSSGNGIGISNIRERVGFYNGKLTILTSPGNGYKINIIIPRAGIDKKKKTQKI